jgi:hypothetical protein
MATAYIVLALSLSVAFYDPECVSAKLNAGNGNKRNFMDYYYSRV